MIGWAVLVMTVISALIAAVLGLEFNDSVDLTAIGTLALALVTIISLVFAKRSPEQTQHSIDQSQLQLERTQEEIAISRREVEEAHRPVVVPVADHREIEVGGRLRAAMGGTAFPRVYETGRLMAPIENIGSGPALGIEASVKLLDADGKPSQAPMGLPDSPATVAGLGQTVILPLDIGAERWTKGASFELTLTYEDVAGGDGRPSGVTSTTGDATRA